MVRGLVAAVARCARCLLQLSGAQSSAPCYSILPFGSVLPFCKGCTSGCAALAKKIIGNTLADYAKQHLFCIIRRIKSAQSALQNKNFAQSSAVTKPLRLSHPSPRPSHQGRGAQGWCFFPFICIDISFGLWYYNGAGLVHLLHQ